jgi:glycosyltransferase involved in cell wall biosynthesis
VPEREAVEANIPAARRPIRLLTLTTLFPNAVRPRHGIFVANRLRRLCDTGEAEAHVIAPIPWFPGAYRDAAAVPGAEAVDGFDVLHPRYLNVPGIGMRMQPALLARAVLRALRRGPWDASRFDVVDAHYFYPDGIAAAKVADVLGLPLVISARGSDINLIGEMTFAREAMLRAAGRAQALVAVSRALSDRMSAMGMPPARTHVLRNGVDVQLFAPVPRAEARQRLRLDETAPWVLGVGNLVAEKRFDLLIRAVAAMPGARLLIVGEGRLLQSLSALAEAVAPRRVEFRANMPQAELRYAYAAADVLGLCSSREGWPNVVLEAIACGTPVVASAVGGVEEILGPGAPGEVIDSDDPDAWSEALAQLVAAAMPQRTVCEYSWRFGWTEVVTKQCELYESVVREWRAAGSALPRGRARNAGEALAPSSSTSRNT